MRLLTQPRSHNNGTRSQITKRSRMAMHLHDSNARRLVMFHLPFADRVEAGRLLARELALRKITPKTVVLALTRGGVPVGFAVADRLRLPLDVVVVRKLGVPWQPELAMGALAGTARVLDDQLIHKLGIWQEDIERVIAREQEEMKRREELLREGKPALDVRDKTAILIDDGLATGSTMLAAVLHVRSLEPAKIIMGVPVASRAAIDRLRTKVDDLVCLAAPDLFFAVGEWYRDFQQVSDSEVRKLLAQSPQQLLKYSASSAVV
jgi:putative phosphoribosyl transferase